MTARYVLRRAAWGTVMIGATYVATAAGVPAIVPVLAIWVVLGAAVRKGWL